MKIRWKDKEKSIELSHISFEDGKFLFKEKEADCFLWFFEGSMYLFEEKSKEFWDSFCSKEVVGVFDDNYNIYALFDPKQKMPETPFSLLYVEEYFEFVGLYDYNENTTYQLSLGEL